MLGEIKSDSKFLKIIGIIAVFTTAALGCIEIISRIYANTSPWFWIPFFSLLLICVFFYVRYFIKHLSKNKRIKITNFKFRKPIINITKTTCCKR